MNILAEAETFNFAGLLSKESGDFNTHLIAQLKTDSF